MKAIMVRGSIIVAFAILLFLMTAATAGAADKSTALTVTVTSVAERPLRSDIIAAGNVVAWREIPVGAETSGLAVIEVRADEGDIVRKGEILARLNSGILSAQMAQQKAVITELEATLATAQSDVNRARSVSAGVISGQTTEQRETLVKTTTAKLAAARAALEEVEVRLRQTDIAAPSDGLISSRSAALGQVVQTGTELFRLIQGSRIEVDALVPEADLADVKPGQSVSVIGPTGLSQQAKVRIIAPTVDAKTRLGTVRIALPADTPLKPGMFARVQISPNAKQALTVPLKALVWRQSRPAVFKIADGAVAVLTEVTIGRKTSEFVEITQGLKSGETIVADGAGLLNSGDRVRVAVATAQGSQAP